MRCIEIQTEIGAPPEAVWRALTAPEELIRWFPIDARVHPGEGGLVWLSWGVPVIAESRIIVWEPLRRLELVEDRPLGILLQPEEANGMPPRTLKYALTPSNGKTHLLLVHDGFGDTPQWDKLYLAVSRGWAFQFRGLRLYLERHAGTPRRIVQVRQRYSMPAEQVWDRIVEMGRLPGGARLSSASEGQPCSMSPPGIGEMRGALQIYDPPWQLAMIWDACNHAFFRIYLVEYGGETEVSVFLATFGVAAAEVETYAQTWTGILKQLIPQAAVVGASGQAAQPSAEVAVRQ